MAMTLNLSAADQAKPGTIKYQVRWLRFERGIRWDVPTSAFVAEPAKSAIYIDLIGEGGIIRNDIILGTEADALLITLNKANLSAGNDLHKRVLDWLRTNRGLAGSISGTSD